MYGCVRGCVRPAVALALLHAHLENHLILADLCGSLSLTVLELTHLLLQVPIRAQQRLKRVATTHQRVSRAWALRRR